MMSYVRRQIRLPICGLVCITAMLTLASAQAATPLFPDAPDTASPLVATLSTDLKQVMQRNADEVDGSLAVTIDGITKSYRVKVSPRGKSRQERCRFFPLWLNFKKSELPGTIFEGQNKLKLVTHCSNTYSPRGFVAAEMLVYRLLNIVTDESFRVRAVHMTYTDTSNGKSSSHPAFLIEHKNSLAKRTQGKLLKGDNPRIRELEPELAAKLALFQYMIGNTDYSFVQGPDPEDCCHNTVPLVHDGGEGSRSVVSVPYDFDVTGLVNVPYAAPAQSLGIKRLTQRLYRGYCRHNDHLIAAIKSFQELQPAIREEISTFSDLPGLKREKHLKFIDGFYKTLESERSQRSRLFKKCR